MDSRPGRQPVSRPRLRRDASSSRAPAADPRAHIRTRALALGFDAVGFAAATLGETAKAGLVEFLAAGRHGDMGWMKARADQRSDPHTLWPEARSVIVVGLNYGPAGDPLATLGHGERGTVSVYARGRDYHDIMKNKLRVLARHIAETFDAGVKLFVDTAPVMEKPLAAAAGVGWQGKHTNLVSRRFGSWLFLGEIYTTLAIAPDDAHADRCGTCSRCLAACPTDAFPAPYQLDARRCISYLTIEHRGHIPREFRAAIGNRVYGCDDCLAVCPWNRFARAATEPGLAPRLELGWPRLGDLAMLDDTAFRTVFSGSPVKRLGRDRFIRNVLIAIGNSRRPALAVHAERLLDDPSPLVRAMAVWALQRLMPCDGFAALRAARLHREADEVVRSEWTAPA